MEQIIGRESEIQVLQEALASPQAELIAIYGRRRVGKTYLIRTVYEKKNPTRFYGLKRCHNHRTNRKFYTHARYCFQSRRPVASAYKLATSLPTVDKSLGSQTATKKTGYFFR